MISKFHQFKIELEKLHQDIDQIDQDFKKLKGIHSERRENNIKQFEIDKEKIKKECKRDIIAGKIFIPFFKNEIKKTKKRIQIFAILSISFFTVFAFEVHAIISILNRPHINNFANLGFDKLYEHALNYDFLSLGILLSKYLQTSPPQFMATTAILTALIGIFYLIKAYQQRSKKKKFEALLDKHDLIIKTDSSGNYIQDTYLDDSWLIKNIGNLVKNRQSEEISYRLKLEKEHKEELGYLRKKHDSIEEKELCTVQKLKNKKLDDIRALFERYRKAINKEKKEKENWFPTRELIDASDALDVLDKTLMQLKETTFGNEILLLWHEVKDKRVKDLSLKIPSYIQPFSSFSYYFKTTSFRDEGGHYDTESLKSYADFHDEIRYQIAIRCLCSVPANKLKLTFIDPLGLGTNFSDLTPLKRDIYGGKVITKSDQITEALDTILRHIETVVQVYLQNQYNTITQYNEENGIYEPYYLLMVKDFPSGFSKDNITQLKTILNIGSRAGVSVFIEEAEQPVFPYDADELEILSNCKLNNGDFIKDIFGSSIGWGAFKLNQDTGKSTKNLLISRINQAYEAQSRDIIPFPVSKFSENWVDSSAKHLRFNIGNTAKESCHLTFNSQNENQALLIGNPGSGKSNLLHTILLSGFLNYSPDEFELHLVDFKGGVEFKVYGDYEIPHIKTLAIDSDREFGFSVLNEIEQTLDKRARLFSEEGDQIQNIRDFKEKNPDKLMPRILFVVDEFQEYFQQDDDLRYNVEKKLTRIIKLGRAFGIHILFASQTLQGNSIPKDARDLVNIRIALPCSNADAYEIMNDRNQAALDLHRPGEGILNDRGGHEIGNRKFQAYFLENETITHILEQIEKLSKSSNFKNKRKATILRSKRKAYIQDSEWLNVTNPDGLVVTLGTPITVDKDVKLLLNSSLGQNIFIGGNNSSLNYRNLSSVIASFIINSEKKIKISSVDGLSATDEDYKSVAKLLNEFSTTYKENKSEELLEKLSLEIDERLQDKVHDTNHLLVLTGFDRLRNFRTMNYEKPRPAMLLEKIYSSGPEIGIYTLILSNNFKNVLRNIDHQNIMGHFNHKLLSQMNEENSFKLLSNNQLSTLNKDQAIWHNDIEGSMTKYFPFEIPNIDLIKQMNKRYE